MKTNKMKVCELTGTALDWAVEKCEKRVGQVYLRDGKCYEPLFEEFLCYSTDWSQGGPIIEREGISVMRVYKDYDEPWCAERGEEHFTEAPTPLIAAMRCYVASKLGDEVDVPPALI